MRYDAILKDQASSDLLQPHIRIPASSFNPDLTVILNPAEAQSSIFLGKVGGPAAGVMLMILPSVREMMVHIEEVKLKAGSETLSASRNEWAL